MSIDPEDFEVPRTAAQLRCFIKRVRSDIQADRTEFESGMAKQGLYKLFLDELEPLCNFAQAAYPKNYKVRPILGNQGYDAIVLDDQGIDFDKIELTKPYDGAEVASSSRQAVARGYSDLQVCDHTEVLEDLIPFFEATSKVKSQKDYGGVTVVFTLAAPPPLSGIEVTFERQVERIKTIIAAHKFKAKRVLLYVPPGRVLPIDG